MFGGFRPIIRLRTVPSSSVSFHFWSAPPEK